MTKKLKLVLPTCFRGETEFHDVFVCQLEAFLFPSHDAAVLFAHRLPRVTALELLMVQNGYDFEMRTGNPRILQ